MAEILEFRPAPIDRERASLVGPCEVVIFPGVRIERDAFSLADRVNVAASGKPGSRRSSNANDE